MRTKEICAGALYLDLRKAFDSVHHGCLLQKIQCYDIIDKELEWFVDYLFLRKQCTICEEIISDTYITHGVPRGQILGTPHKIYRPQVGNQREYFSGHRRYYLMNTQLIVDNLGNIVFLQAGSLSDDGNFMLMETIGPCTDYDMPMDVVLLADKGYGDTNLLLTPFRTAQIRCLPRDEKILVRRFKYLCRIIVEHTIKHMKTYQAVGSIWRHSRWFKPVVVELCTFLAQRHVGLFYDV